MYICNIFCFGHKMADNKKLNNFISDLDLEFSKSINGKIYEVSYPYHGGQVNGDDNNPNYINEIRNAKEEDYIKEYNIFISEYINILKNDDFSYLNEDELKILKELIDFLEKTKPCFYSVEISS